MNSERMEQLAEQLLGGRLALADFLREAAQPATADLDEAQIDLDRRRRCGYPEVVFGEGKTVATLDRIFQALLASGVEVLATRISAEQAANLQTAVSQGPIQSDRPHISRHRADRARQPAAHRPRGRRHCRHKRSAGGRGSPRNACSGWAPA